MVWAATSVTFLATALFIVAVAYAFTASGKLVIAERLTRLWNPAVPAPRSRFREKQKERVARVLTDVGKLVPGSTKNLSRTQRLLVRAGYRRPETVMTFRGVKLLLPILFLTLAYTSGAYVKKPAMVFGFAVIAGFLLPEIWLTHMIRRRQHRLRLGLPDGLDLLLVCVEAGLGLDQAILRVGQELRIAHPELSEELQLVNMEMRVGKTRLEALRELGQRTGLDDIKALVAMLIQTDRFGTSIAQSLRVHSDNLRTKRRQRAEEEAAKTPVKMVPVLVFFIFPALFAVILGPAVITMVRQLLPTLAK
jgi:tight adherence protein C